MKLKLDKILKNKIVLYLTFFLSLVTIFGYLIKQNYQAILFFTLVLFLTKYFSNNMIVILGISIIATNFLDLFRLFSSAHLEGMENNKNEENNKTALDDLKILVKKLTKDSEEIAKVNNDEKIDKNKKEVKLDKMKNNAKESIKKIDNIISEIDNLTDSKFILNNLEIAKNNYLSDYPDKEILSQLDKIIKNIKIITQKERENENIKKLKKNVSLSKKEEEIIENNCSSDENWDGTKCVAKKKETMATLNPANIGEVNNSGSGNLNNFNDAKMKEMAFDNLDKIFGSDGMRSLSNEANSLNEKQNAIMSQLKDIGPLISQAMNLIKNVDMDAINSVSSKMTGMINNLQDLKTNQ